MTYSVIPIYVYIFVFISIEKRLAMELISRTMQDMQSQDSELLSDALNSDQSSTTNINKYFFFKLSIHKQ